MIGNDVVDLQVALLESNWHRRGYLDKLFSAEEQKLIAKSNQPNQTIWLLWTMKESSYKVHFRENKIRRFQPSSLICKPIFIRAHSVTELIATGVIQYEGKQYFSKSIINEEFIHTVSAVHPSIITKVKIEIKNKPIAYQGCFQEELQYDFFQGDYQIVKNSHHVPELLNRLTGQRYPMSISHHGRFHTAIYLTDFCLPYQ